MAIITLITDFGTRDEYVGVLKGVIGGIAPETRIIDITHHIPAHDICGAAFLLKAAFPWFPAGSIHMAVVDPGVGSARAIVAAQTAGHFFIAPDNGLLIPLIDAHGSDALIAVEARRYFREPFSRTFHGRDIFAPVAARLSLGAALREFGPPIDRTRLNGLSWPQAHIDENGCLHGHVVWVDRFGNLITDLQHAQLEAVAAAGDGKSLHIHVAGRIIKGLASCYSEVPEGAPAAIIGSRECLEIAVNRGSAESMFALGRGAPVLVSAARDTAPAGGVD